MLLQSVSKKSFLFFDSYADISFSFYPKYFSKGTVLFS